MNLSYGVDLLLTLQDLRNEMPDLLVDAIAQTSNLSYYVMPVVIIALMMWSGWNRSDCTKLILVLAVTHAIYGAMNQLFMVDRPWVIEPAVVPFHYTAGFSFPSGHSAMTMAFMGMLSIICRRRWVTVSCIAVTGYVVFTRLLLGAHTPTDVVAGAVVGLIAIIIIDQLSKRFDIESCRLQMCVIAFVIIGAAYCIVHLISVEPVDAVNGDVAYYIYMTSFPIIMLLGIRISEKTGIPLSLPDGFVYPAAGAAICVLLLLSNNLFHLHGNALNCAIMILTDVLIIAYPLVLNRMRS